jgi:ubiquinone/menaquinone biosynthesis C-methylase UbiE
MNMVRGRFKGTAWFYARYRPWYPDVLFNYMKDSFHLNGSENLLDLGCGPGHLAIPIAKYVKQVIGVDPEPEMLIEAERLADYNKVKNIKWVRGSSNELDRLLFSDKFKLTTMGRSFHWMDREHTLSSLFNKTLHGGGITIIQENHDETRKRKWQKAINLVTERWLGERKEKEQKYPVEKFSIYNIKDNDNNNANKNKKHHDKFVAASNFSDMKIWKYNYQRTWNIRSIMGLLYSKSSSSIYVLGNKRKLFQDDIIKTLSEIQPSGEFIEDVSLEAILAWKQ